MMQDNYTSKGKHLTESERQLIERWHNKEKLSNREIAYRLGKDPQTIHNEIHRGTIQLKRKTKYSAKIAQESYESARNAFQAFYKADFSTGRTNLQSSAKQDISWSHSSRNQGGGLFTDTL